MLPHFFIDESWFSPWKYLIFIEHWHWKYCVPLPSLIVEPPLTYHAYPPHLSASTVMGAGMIDDGEEEKEDALDEALLCGGGGARGELHLKRQRGEMRDNVDEEE